MDPMTELEDAKAQHDLGVTMFRIYCGARAEQASRMEACMIVYAWTRAMFAEADVHQIDRDEEGEDE